MQDLEALKQQVTIRQVVTDMLSIKVNHKARCICPLCEGDGFTVYDKTNSFFCHSCKKGGHIITLIRLKNNCEAKDAGEKIAAHFNINAPYKRASAPADRRDFDPEEWRKSLDPAHEALGPLDLSADILKEFGGGFNKNTYMRGMLCLPVRTADGTPFAFIGINIETREVKLPKSVTADWLFNSDRATKGTLHVASHPLDVLYHLQSGVPDLANTIAPLCGSPYSLELTESIVALAREREADALEFHH